MIENKHGRGKTRLEGLKERLYSRTKYKVPEDYREPIAQNESEPVPSGWQTPKIEDILLSGKMSGEGHPIVRKIFLIASLFFLCSGIAASLIYFKGDNFISTRNLDISVEGPINIAVGSPVELELTIINKNNSILDNVNLKVSYPDGTRDASDSNQILTDVEEKLKEFSPGEKLTKNIKAIFFGSEGETKTVVVSVDYRVRGSNATFTKEKVFDLTISNAPVVVSITRPEKVVSGDEMNLSIVVTANSEDVLRNVILRAEYPYGWSFKSSSLSASNKEKNLWSLGDISPGDKKTINIKGSLIGEDTEERVFRFFVGVGKSGTLTFDTTLNSNFVTVIIERPSVDLDIKLNNDSSQEYVAPAGRQIQGTVNFKNNLSENLINPQVEVRFSGGALDKGMISTKTGGLYNSSLNNIVWNGSNSSNIETLTPGDSGFVAFEFASLKDLPLGSINQKIDLLVTVTGRLQDSNTDVKITETRSVKIASEVILRGESLYSRGPFANRGPIPPKAETETTYTITLDASNTRNDVQDVKVTGVLGANVQWAEEVSPIDEPGLSYDEATRTVTWSLGTLSSGAGFSSPGKEVSFKLSLIPSQGQIGGAPLLFGNIALTGFDPFTNSPIRITHQAITTKITNDPRYVQGDEIVVK